MRKLFLLLIASILLQSCATIFQGSKQRVFITTEPSTARIYVNDEYLGSGHAEAKLKRSKQHTIMAKNDGYQNRYMTIDNNFQAGWLIADIFTGWLGIIVDACTGSWNTFDKQNYIIQLDKK